MVEINIISVLSFVIFLVHNKFSTTKKIVWKKHVTNEKSILEYINTTHIDIIKVRLCTDLELIMDIWLRTFYYYVISKYSDIWFFSTCVDLTIHHCPHILWSTLNLFLHKGNLLQIRREPSYRSLRKNQFVSFVSAEWGNNIENHS